MRVRNSCLGAWLLMLLATGAAQAETLPSRGTVDGRIRNATYEADQVYRLYGFVGYAIELIFELGEAFVGAGGGDLEGVTIDAHANAVLLKPRAAVVVTNLVIYTDRRAYRFDYSAEARRPNRPSDEVIYAVRFAYPDGDGGPGSAQAVGLELAAAKTAQPRNSNYWFCGHASLRPSAASDDGVHTRLTFADAAELPALFVRNEDGSESLLNFSVDKGDVIVHRLAPQLIVRRGRLTGCIVNRSYGGSGARLATGTVSPHIERESKAPQP